jgi:hypothetical protein
MQLTRPYARLRQLDAAAQQKMKLKHWRGVSSTFRLKAAPVLGFYGLAFIFSAFQRIAE